MKFIKVTSAHSKKEIYLNVDMIGSIKEDIKHTSQGQKDSTIIGHLCHNNGGYEVLESVEIILKLIKNAK
jgi:hypothetical protein